MNVIRILPIVVFTVIVVGRTVTLADDQRQHTADSLDTVRKMVAEKKAVLLDVRELREWQRGHVRGAVHVPLSQLSKQATDPEFLKRLAETMPEGKVVYVHCASGHRCLLACDVLEKLAQRDLRPLKPGYKDLIAAGFDNEVDAEAPR